MSLNEKNYFSPENQLKFMGSPQFKSFMSCEAAALAEVRGEYHEPESDALLIGSYVDSYYSGTLEEFKAETPQIFTQKGELKAAEMRTLQLLQICKGSDPATELCGNGGENA